jgi:hypothetical protein
MSVIFVHIKHDTVCVLNTVKEMSENMVFSFLCIVSNTDMNSKECACAGEVWSDHEILTSFSVNVAI